MIENLPKKLRTLRTLKRMNKKNAQFAIFLDVSVDTLKNWLSGRCNPSISSEEYLRGLFELEGI